MCEKKWVENIWKEEFTQLAWREIECVWWRCILALESSSMGRVVYVVGESASISEKYLIASLLLHDMCVGGENRINRKRE